LIGEVDEGAPAAACSRTASSSRPGNLSLGIGLQALSNDIGDGKAVCYRSHLDAEGLRGGGGGEGVLNVRRAIVWERSTERATCYRDREWIWPRDPAILGAGNRRQPQGK